MGLICHYVCVRVGSFVCSPIGPRCVPLRGLFLRKMIAQHRLLLALSCIRPATKPAALCVEDVERVGDQTSRRFRACLTRPPFPWGTGAPREPLRDAGNAVRLWERKRDVGLWPARATRGRAARPQEMH